MMRPANLITTVLICAISVFGIPAMAAEDPLESENATSDVQTIRAVFATPDNALDLAMAKLTFDKLVDPSINIDRTLHEIDQMVQVVKATAGPNPTTIQKLRAVRRFIYVDGDWNGHRPFQYDMSDPLGKKITNKLLPVYITTRRGNCVSMPILFIILANRLGVHVTASTAPFHVFAKFVDDSTGKTYNLETTNGAFPVQDAWLRHNLPMGDLAIKNGVYLKTLTKKETVAVMADIVLEHDIAEGRWQEVIDTADVILRYYPNFTNAILDHGIAAAFLMDTEYKQKYRTLNDIPPSLLPTYILLGDANHADFARAEALGWRETDGITPTSPPNPISP
jgi:regulator of sirC expression with transglutaminase-like and TPR domain